MVRDKTQPVGRQPILPDDDRFIDGNEVAVPYDREREPEGNEHQELCSNDLKDPVVIPTTTPTFILLGRWCVRARAAFLRWAAARHDFFVVVSCLACLLSVKW